MPIKNIKIYGSENDVFAQAGHNADVNRLRALIKALEEGKQDLGFIDLNEFIIPGKTCGTLPKAQIDLLKSYLIDKVSLNGKVYHLVKNSSDTLSYFNQETGTVQDQVDITISTGFFFAREAIINHADMNNLDYLSSGHTGFAGIEFGTTAHWANMPTYRPVKGMLVIYTDYAKDKETGADIPGFKIGNGNTYLVDLPFFGGDTAQILKEHIEDNVRHITQDERIRWNNKLNYKEDPENPDLLWLTRD